MTPALKAMVEAMASEIAHQALMRVPVRMREGDAEVDLSGIELEKVARAGLAALRDQPFSYSADGAVLTAIMEAQRADRKLAEETKAKTGGYPAWIGSEGEAARRAIVDAILKETP